MTSTAADPYATPTPGSPVYSPWPPSSPENHAPDEEGAAPSRDGWTCDVCSALLQVNVPNENGTARCGLCGWPKGTPSDVAQYAENEALQQAQAIRAGAAASAVGQKRARDEGGADATVFCPSDEDALFPRKTTTGDGRQTTAEERQLMRFFNSGGGR